MFKYLLLKHSYLDPIYDFKITFNNPKSLAWVVSKAVTLLYLSKYFSGGVVISDLHSTYATD